MKFQYSYYCRHYSVKENRILFESFHGKTISDSPYYILLELLNSEDVQKFEIYYASITPKEHIRFVQKNHLPIKIVNVDSFKYAKILATSKYLVNNSSFPAYFIRRNEQIYLQTWHGTPLKTLGKEMRLGIESMYNVQHNFMQANYIMFPNEYTRDIIMSDYNLTSLYTGKIAMLGYPRNIEFLTKNNTSKLRDRYELDRNTKNIAYMPTWRGTSNHDISIAEYCAEVMNIFSYIDEHLSEGQCIWVNFHPLVAQSFEVLQYEHIRNFPNDVDNYVFLNEMDLLITDYSSVFFDYSLTYRPIILFMYDFDSYLSDRGIYLDLKELPFTKVFSAEELISCLNNHTYECNSYINSDYANEFLKYDSSHNAKRALTLLFNEPDESIKIIDYSDNIKKQWNIVDFPQQKTKEDIDTVAKTINPDQDIVIFTKGTFTQDLSAHLYDSYRNNFNFVFITRTTPRTYIEDITKRFISKTQKRLQDREVQRVFGKLNVRYIFDQNIWYPSKGYSYGCSYLPQIFVNAYMKDNADLCIELINDSYIPEVFLLAKKRTFVWSQIATKMGDKWIINLKEAFKAIDFKIGDKLSVMAQVYNLDTQAHSLVTFIPNRSLKFFKDDKLQSCLGFIDIGICTQKNEVLNIVPYYGYKTMKLSLLISKKGFAVGAFKYALLDNISIKGNNISLKIRIRNGNFSIKKVALIFRSSVENLSVDLTTTVSFFGKWKKWNIINAEVDVSSVNLKEIYWDAFVLLNYNEQVEYIPIKFRWGQRMALYLGINACFLHDKGTVLFTHIAKGNKLAFVYRSISQYDSYATRLKEFGALFVFAIFHPYWKRRRMWIVYEKFCSLAQDNGFAFFKYCMDELPPSQNSHIYYVIDEKSSDYQKVRPYDSQVVKFMSFKHILYTMVAKIYIASDSKSHLYVWRPMPSLVMKRIRHHKIFFLQHGVTALKRVDNLFGKNSSGKMTYFLTTSLAEQNIIVEEFKYDRIEAPILGFSRWDLLRNIETKEAPVILIMPTWRPWLEEQSDQVFVMSDYFKAYSSLIQNQELKRLLEFCNATIKFFIHPKLSNCLKQFKSENPRIKLIEQNSQPLNEIMMECSLLITDYSSVCWDVLYMNKPVVFYQFDKDMYLNYIGSYLDFESELPGALCTTEDELLSIIKNYCQSNFELQDIYKTKADKWFARKDTCNRQRTYNFILEQEANQFKQR